MFRSIRAALSLQGELGLLRKRLGFHLAFRAGGPRFAEQRPGDRVRLGPDFRNIAPLWSAKAVAGIWRVRDDRERPDPGRDTFGNPGDPRRDRALVIFCLGHKPASVGSAGFLSGAIRGAVLALRAVLRGWSAIPDEGLNSTALGRDLSPIIRRADSALDDANRDR